MSHVIRRACHARFLALQLVASASLCAVLPVAAAPAEAPRVSEREVSLAELLAFAASHAPVIRVAAQRRAYGAAARAGAEPLLAHNPNLEVGAGPRFAGDATSYDVHVRLEQPVEIGGQRRLRLNAATHLEQRLDAEVKAAAWQARADVWLAFQRGVLARERLAITARAAQFAEELLALTRRRLAAGDASAIDVRVAETDAAQTRRIHIEADQELRSRGIDVALIVGWPIDTPLLFPAGVEPPGAPPPLAPLLRRATERQPELQTRRAASAEARARVELADRSAWPTPSIGVQLEREGSVDSAANIVVLGSVTLPLPLWDRNQGERAERRVEADVAQLEEGLTQQALAGRIARSHAALSSAYERVALFTSSARPAFESGLALLQRGFAAGELSLLSVAAARERFLQAQLDSLDAYADYYAAFAELESAVGGELGADLTVSTGGAP